MMGWQWHQLDHMQLICITLQTDNYASTPSVIFYGPDASLTIKPCIVIAEVENFASILNCMCHKSFNFFSSAKSFRITSHTPV